MKRKRAHKVKPGETIRMTFEGRDLGGYVVAIQNSSRLTTISLESGEVHVVNRGMHVEVLNK